MTRQYATIEQPDEFRRIRGELSDEKNLSEITKNIDFMVKKIMEGFRKHYRSAPIDVEKNHGEIVLARRGSHFQFCYVDMDNRDWKPIKGSMAIDASVLMQHGMAHVNKLKYALEKAILAWIPEVTDAKLQFERVQSALALAIVFISFPDGAVDG